MILSSALAVQSNDYVSVAESDYQRFCDFFHRMTGICFRDDKRHFVERRLAGRIAATRSEDFHGYFSLLRGFAGGPEMQQLVNELTINETYFFREEYQLDALTEAILPEITAEKVPGTPVRLWSVPCSSGEEPYSMAIAMLEHWGACDNWDVQITASDIDSRILAQARAGVYGERSLGRVPAHLRSRYFRQCPGGGLQICDALRRSINFSLVNVVDPMQTRDFRQMDVIFCRNLLIYFDELTRRRTVEMFYEALQPGGFICLGHAESMSRISDLFQPRKFGDAIVYQKPVTARR